MDKKPMPQFFKPLAGDQDALFDRLAHVVEEAGISVDLSEHTGKAQGYSQGGRITLKVGLDSTSRVLALLHEYAHELLHWSAQGMKQPVSVKECHAEAVSYVVAHHFGIHNPFSADYLHTWGTDSKTLIAELEVVRRTAAHIIERVQKGEAQPETDTEVPVAKPVGVSGGNETALRRDLPPKRRYSVYHTNVNGGEDTGGYDTLVEAKAEADRPGR